MRKAGPGTEPSRSLLRYLAAWALGGGMVWAALSGIGLWDEGWMRWVLSGLISAAAVLAAFVVGLPLRIRVLGADWNRGAWVAGPLIVLGLALHVWAGAVAAWLLGMDPARLPSERGGDWPAWLALIGAVGALFLLVNFPRRSRIGLRFAETFDPARRRCLRWGGTALGLAVAAWYLVPVPMSGYWHTPYSDCLCDSKNLIVFEDGQVFRWASGHGLAREPMGTYRRGLYSVTWDTGDEVLRFRPGWFFIRLHPDNAPAWMRERRQIGYREWRGDYIREALATLPMPWTSYRGGETDE